MTSHGCNNCAIGNFVKFRGGDAMHFNHAMLEECISISITSCFLVGAHLPYLEPGHDPPLYIIDRVVGYIILWPWKLTTKFY
jgi:hypothetical protein